MNRKTVLIGGYYGFGNIGDEAILECILRDLRGLEPSLAFVIASGDPAETTGRHGVPAVAWTNVSALMAAAESCDLVLLGGGGLFHDYWPFEPDARLTRDHAGISYYSGFSALAVLFDKPLMMYAVGVGPLLTAEGRKSTREAFLPANVIAVREAESRSILESLGVGRDRIHVTADPAFGLRSPAPEHSVAFQGEAGLSGSPRPWAGVALRHWDLGSPPRWEAEVASALDSFLDRHRGSVAFVPLQDGREPLVNDADVAGRIRNRLRNGSRAVVVPRGSSLHDRAGVLAACDLVLGMRFHSLVFALAAGVPVVALAYDPKIRRLMVEAGLENRSVDLAAVHADGLDGLLQQALESSPAAREALRVWAGAVAVRARQTARLAVEILHRPSERRVTLDAETNRVLRSIATAKTRQVLEAQTHADRVRSETEKLANQVTSLETRVKALERELDLQGERAAAAERRRAAAEQALAALERQHAAAKDVIASLEGQCASADRTVATLQRELQTIKATLGWRLLQHLWRLRRGVAPPDSVRGDFVRLVVQGLRAWQRHGIQTIIARATQRLVRSAVHRTSGWRFSAGGAAMGATGATLLGVVERTGRSKGAVIFLPSIGWRVNLFQRPHHLARTFAQQGYVAVFDSSNAFDEVDGFQEIDHNLFLFSGPAQLLHQIPSPLLWTFPYNYDKAAAYPIGAKVVYDWIDDLAVFIHHEPQLLTRNHERALREAHLVTCVARVLHEQVRVIRPDALYLPNGVEDARITSPDGPVANDPALELLRRESKPIAGYYGALADWFDYEMLEEVARLRPDWNFLLIGPEYDDSLSRTSLTQRPNVAWIGPRPYAALPGYLRAFDVATIPFRLNPITMATSPLKLYEYFAGGKPVITTPMPECTAHPEVTAVNNAAEFAKALDPVRKQGRDPQFRRRLRAVAAANSWTERVRTVEKLVEALREAPPSGAARSSASPRST